MVTYGPTAGAAPGVTFATLVFVVPAALVVSRMHYNVAGAVKLVRDLSQPGMPPPESKACWGPRSRPLLPLIGLWVTVILAALLIGLLPDDAKQQLAERVVKHSY